MKKGVLALDELVSLIPHILVTLALLYLIGYLIGTLFRSEQTPQDQDFDRIIADFDDLVKNPDFPTTPVPISNPNGMILATYSQDKSPSVCKNSPCVCIYYEKDKKRIENCHIYKQLDDCKETCISGANHLTLTPDQKSVTISRRNNAILIT